METRPLLTCHHSAIGTKKHKARTATAHMAYILRSGALTKFISEHLPEQGQGTTSYFDNIAKEAIEAGRDIRVCDKIILALPKELSFEQQLELVQSFMRQLGQGRIAWGAAFHTKGKDVNNPHAHIVLKDSDIETGKRVLGTTTSAKEVREAEENGWKVPPRLTSNGIRFAYEKHLNSFMEKLGIDIRFDARSYAERGINQIPQMHFGFRAKKLDEMGYGFESRDAEVGNRYVIYSLIDDAPRLDHNQAIRDTNRELAGERAKSSGQIQADRLVQKRTERGAGKELTDAKQSVQHPARDPLPQLPLTREQQETADLRAMQKQALKRLLDEHRLDNAALRKAQDTEKSEHRLWANALYKAARASAFIEMKEHMGPDWRKLNGMSPGEERDKASAMLRSDTEKKWRVITGLPRGEERQKANAALATESKQRWQEVRSMPHGDAREKAAVAYRAEMTEKRTPINGMKAGLERDKAAEALKAETAQKWKEIRGEKPGAMRDALHAQLKSVSQRIYRETAAPKLAEVKQTVDTARKSLLADQGKTRDALFKDHQKEWTLATKQHVFEKLALQESWRAQHLANQSARVERSFSQSQSMPNVQAKAQAHMKLHQRSRFTKSAIGDVAVPENPSAAAKVYLERASHQQNLQQRVRQQHQSARQFNELRSRHIPQELVAEPRLVRSRPMTLAQRKLAALALRDTADKASRAQEAAKGGRTLTTAERANASPAMKERLQRREAADKTRRDGPPVQQAKPRSHGKSRRGGQGR